MKSEKSYGNKRLLFLFAAGVVIGLMFIACSKDPAAPPAGGSGQPQATCVGFEDQTLGNQFVVATTFASDGVNIQVEQFQWSNMTWTNGGNANVDDVISGGAGLDIYPNNCNLNFQFAYPGSKITLKYLGSGGNENLRVNGVFHNVPEIVSLNGTTIDGVFVTVVAGSPGTITLEGNITGFVIGGQEMWIDDVCFTK